MFKPLYLIFVLFSKKGSIIKIDQYQIIFRLIYNNHYFEEDQFPGIY